MAGQRDPGDLGIAVLVLRAVRGWDRAALAEASGVSESSIRRYEAGETIPTAKSFERIEAAVGVPPFHVDRLFAWIRSARAALGRPAGSTESFLDALCGEFSEGLAETLRAGAALILAERQGGLPPSLEGRSGAPPED